MAWETLATDIRGYGMLLTLAAIECLDRGEGPARLWGVDISAVASASVARYVNDPGLTDALVWVRSTGRLGEPNVQRLEIECLPDSTVVHLHLEDRCDGDGRGDRLVITLAAPVWDARAPRLRVDDIAVEFRRWSGGGPPPEPRPQPDPVVTLMTWAERAPTPATSRATPA